MSDVHEPPTSCVNSMTRGRLLPLMKAFRFSAVRSPSNLFLPSSNWNNTTSWPDDTGCAQLTLGCRASYPADTFNSTFNTIYNFQIEKETVEFAFHNTLSQNWNNLTHLVILFSILKQINYANKIIPKIACLLSVYNASQLGKPVVFCCCFFK